MVIKAGAVNIAATMGEVAKIAWVQETGIGSPVEHAGVGGGRGTVGVS